MVRSEVIKGLEHVKEVGEENPQFLTMNDVKALDQAIYEIKRARDMVIVGGYECDPRKAKGCKKTMCFAHGGECYTTKNREWEWTDGAKG